MKFKKPYNFRKNGDNDDQGEFEPIPSGVYNFVIEDDQEKATQQGDGKRLVFRMRVLDGEYKNRKAWIGLNIKHPKENVQEIAWKHFDRCCKAIFPEGKNKIKATGELHEKPFTAALELNGGFHNVKRWTKIKESDDDESEDLDDFVGEDTEFDDIKDQDDIPF